MILPLLKDYWFVLFAIVLSKSSSIGFDSDGYIARAIMKSWFRQAEEQRARLFLPKDVEASYTTVVIFNNRICLRDFKYCLA